MTTHKESRTLPYTADVMYAIVADVEKYPQFLPWVTGLRVVRRISDTAFDAEMRVGFAGLSERYVSRVTLDPAAHTIDVVKTQGGPFRRLENHWRFTPKTESTCEVSFAIAFEFKNPILNAVAGRAFQTVMLQMASAFEARARVLTKRT
ncbi:type II toxin-antitoxin system RatA family toxin [Rhizomicrobium electricum]|uniref:Type II toxin-antitoxin system RatA family toxin n=1 Tax=Rhizomicrobium electricum TaxID=480070 RepID=A0ABN1F0Y9_9PROT|nr:type II toxin-antitoxin system RatA family toxin [Rhizomicrobium electricum]NIJ50160.1 coenzyme Q-binding protein COQ10 [Rhizomicrobium electricum]